jgi:hypothetical protein
MEAAMTTTTTNPTKLEEARKRWGTAQVHTATVPASGVRGVSAAFAVEGARVSRVTEQRRDISAHKLER